MPSVKLNSLNLRIYALAVDGRGYNSGFTIREIASMVRLSEERVRIVLIGYESEGFISRIPHAKRPIFWRREPRANILDKAIADKKTTNDGESVKSLERGDRSAKEVSTPVNSIMAYVPTIRLHNARILFEVIKLGEMHSIKWTDETGTVHVIPLFPKDPYRNHNNSESWKTQLPFEGLQVSIDLLISRSRMVLSVFPPELEITPEEVPLAETMMTSRASQVVAILTKHGGWKLGLPVLKSRLDYASTDEQLARHIGKIIKTEDSRLWTDCSIGDPEMETNDPELAQSLFDFPNIIRKVEGAQRDNAIRMQDHDTRIMNVEDSLATHESVLKHLVEIKQLEQATTKSNTADNSGESPPDVTVKIRKAKGFNRDYEVIYQ